MSIRRPARAAAALALIAALAGQPAHAGDRQAAISANLTLGTDYMFRGVSQTLGGAAAQVSLGVDFQSGLYGYVWGSNVDFVPDGGVEDGANIEIDSALGYATGLGDRWSLDAMLVHYRFPGTVDAADYDYFEAVTTLTLDDRYAATVAFSNDVFASGKPGLHFGLEADIHTSANYSVTLGLGHYDLDEAYGASYSHVALSLSRRFETVSIALIVHDTFGDAGLLFPDEAIGTRAVLTLGLDW